MNCLTQPGRTSRWKSNKTLRWAARTLHPTTMYRRFMEMSDSLSDIHSTEAFIHRQLSSKRFAFFSLFTLFVRSHKNYIEFSTSNGISVTVITPHSAMHTERIDMEKDVGLGPTRENTKKHLLSHLNRFSLLSGFKIDCGLTESTIIAKRFINIDFGVSKSKSYFLRYLMVELFGGRSVVSVTFQSETFDIHKATFLNFLNISDESSNFSRQNSWTTPPQI